MPHGPAGTDKAGSEQALLDEAMTRYPGLFSPGWIWLMDRNYHGAARIARLIESAHVLIRLKSDIPLRRTSQILPDGSYRAELSGNGVTVEVRVIEYWVTVEGQEVPEMFCLITDLMDWEEYPGPGLAALYRWRWDGSETALREAKAPLRGAGPGTGPMLPLRIPEPGPAGDRRLGRWNRDDPRRHPRRRGCRGPRRKGRRAGLTVRPRDLSFARGLRAVLSAIRLGRDCYQAVTSEIAGYRNAVDRDRHRARKSQIPLPVPAREREGHRHPHRPRCRHHGQHPSLNSGNTENQAEGTPPGPWTRPPPARRRTRPPACPPEDNYPQ